MIDRARLRQLADAATPGPWATMDEMHRPNGRFVGPEGASPVAIATGYYGERGLSDAAYIAAAHPCVMIDLLNEIDQHIVGATNNRNRYRQEIEAVSDQRDAAVARAESAERELAKRETRG